jgi:hypothetical protein
MTIDVDTLMDRAILATENTFGRTVAYSVQGTAPVVSVRGHYLRRHLEENAGASQSVSTTEDVLDFRVATLAAAGISPKQKDVVTFLGQTWTVVDVQPGDTGTVYLVLGRRTA